MKTVRDILNLSIQHVANQRPRHEIEWLIAEALGITRLDLYLQFDRPMEEYELSKIRSGISRLKKGEPLAYVRGLAPFFKDEFIVSQDVLIPRPETEILVELASVYLSSKHSPGVLFDICTGSGCIGLSIKKLFPAWHIVLSDISEKAIAVTKQNAEKLHVSVDILLGDLLAPFHTKADCIVANPPYLSQKEWESVDSSVQQYEPQIALMAGFSGIEWYERFFAQVHHYINPGACVLVEIGSTQANEVSALAQQHHFAEVSVIQDLSRRDRIVRAIR